MTPKIQQTLQTARRASSVKATTIALAIVLLLTGCSRDREMYSSQYRVPLSKLTHIDCKEYTRIAACETFSFLFNVGHFRSSYFNGKVSVYTSFGELSRRVPLRCGIDKHLRELVRLDNKKGLSERFAQSFTLTGVRKVRCSK